MTTLIWDGSLALGHVQMDRTHEEFVDLLAAVQAARDGGAPLLLDRFATLVAHTEGHFEQEERWMRDCGFDAENCHSRQHAMVLRVMQEVLALARDSGEFTPLKRIADELEEWFPQHARMMDSALVEQMALRGYDPVTRQQTRPQAEAALITGCGSSSCS